MHLFQDQLALKFLDFVLLTGDLNLKNVMIGRLNLPASLILVGQSQKILYGDVCKSCATGPSLYAGCHGLLVIRLVWGSLTDSCHSSRFLATI